MRRGFDQFRQLIVHDPMEIAFPLLIFAATFSVAWVIRRLVLRGLQKWNARTESRAGHILYEGLRGPMLIWCLMLAGHFALESSEIPERFVGVGSDILLGLWILSLTLMSMRVAGDIVRVYGSQVPGAMPVTTLTQTIAQVIVLILGGLILLNHFHVSITPILTALGVGGLAVALALQDTLSNLFGGFYVAIARQVRLGDYIKLNTGEEGYVADIGWRSTTMRALANNLIIVPNAKLSQAIVTNFHLPEKRLGSSFQVTVGYECDLENVEAMLSEVAKAAIGEVPGLLNEPAPSVTFDPGFADNGVGLTVNFQVAEFGVQVAVRNELKRRVFRKLRAAGIRIPYPSRVIYVENEGRVKPSEA